MSDIAELLERFRRGAELIAVVSTGAAGAELDWRPKPEKWSIRYIICHLADSEIVCCDRLRRTIAEDNPTLIGYNQDAWAANLDYSRRKFSQALESFRRLRNENHELLKGLAPEAFQRMATHSEAGPMSLEALVLRNAVHVETHARQIQELRAGYKAYRAAAAAN